MESPERYLHESKTLKNGLTLLWMDLPHVHSLSIHAYVRSGSVYENPKISGVSHLLEHLHMSSTRKHPTRAALSAAFDAIPGTRNAGTSSDLIEFKFDCAPAFGGPTVDLVGDILESRTFDPGDVDLERSLIRSEIDSMDPGHDRVFLGLLFKDHSFGLPVCGTSRSLQRILPGDLARFDRASFKPERMVIAIVGRIEPGVLERAEIRLGSLRTESDEDLIEPAGPNLELPSVHRLTPESEQKRIVVGFVLDSELSLASRSALWTLNVALHQTSFPLLERLRYGASSTYLFEFYLLRACRMKAMYVVTATRRANRDDFAESLLCELARVRDDAAFVAGWLDGVRQVYRYQVETCLDSPESLAWRIGAAEARKQFESVVSIDEELAALESLRTEDIQSLLEGMLRRDRLFLCFDAKTRFRDKARFWKQIGRFLS